jgi:hypothetical protein
MTRYARFNAAGRYHTVGDVPADSPTLLEADVYVGAVDPETQYHTPAGPAAMPARPSLEHDFDWATKTWQPNVERAKAHLRTRIEGERDKRIFAPILAYDGKTLDADAASIDRLTKKLAALDAYEKRGMTMPAPMLVWRDADNITHVFATHAAYKQWLAGFAIALDLRGTQAFAWSWEKKSLVDQALTLEALAAIDPTA